MKASIYAMYRTNQSKYLGFAPVVGVMAPPTDGSNVIRVARREKEYRRENVFPGNREEAARALAHAECHCVH
jgi:hypothetical protein